MFFGTTIVRGGWFQNNPTPPNINIPEPIHTSGIPQVKPSGIRLNAAKNFVVGLHIYGTQTGNCITAAPNGGGCVGIGVVPPNLLEKLNIAGNLSIARPGAAADGGTIAVIDPQTGNKDYGADGHILTISPSGQSMEWTGKAWMSIPRIDILNGGQCYSFFPDCPAGWTEFSVTGVTPACTFSAGGSWAYGSDIRVCSQNF